jgi:hypothetical protein
MPSTYMVAGWYSFAVEEIWALWDNIYVLL